MKEAGPDKGGGFSQAEQLRNISAEMQNAERARLAERHPDWPPVSLNVRLSNHETPGDFDNLGEQMARADVFVYEGGNETLTAFYQSVADIDTSELADPQEHLERFIDETGYMVNGVDGPLRGTPQEMIVRALYGTGKAVLSIDIGDDERQEMRDYLERPQPLLETFDETLEATKTKLVHFAYAQNDREERMTQRFDEEMARLLEERPELKEHELSVLINMGSTHVTLPGKFEEQGYQITTTSQESRGPNTYSRTHNEMKEGREPSREVLAQIFVEGFIRSSLMQRLEGYKSSADATDYIEKAAASLPLDYIEHIYNSAMDKSLLVETFDAMLEETMGAKLPRNVAELRERLGETPGGTNRVAEVRERLAGIQTDDESAVGAEPEAEQAEVKSIAERHPDWPPVKVKLFLSAHVHKADMRGLDEALDGADIYYPEGVGEAAKSIPFDLREMTRRNPRWHLSGYMNRYVRRHKRSDKAAIEGTAYDAQLRAVYGKNLRIGSVDEDPSDVPAKGRRERKAKQEQLEQEEKPPTRLVRTDVGYDDNLAGFEEYMGSFARIQAERERRIPGRLEEDLGKQLKRHRTLRRQPQLEAVLSMGSYHVGLEKQLRAAGFDVEVIRPEGEEDMESPYSEKLQHAMAEGGKPSREEVAYAFMQNAVHGALRTRGAETERYQDQVQYSDKAAAAFSPDELREVYEAMQADESGGFDALDAALESKGLGRVPRNGEELAAAVRAA